MRFAFHISYLGTQYFGWQKQVGQITIQEVIESALSKICGNEKIDVLGCGRTDTGVHAEQFYFHADINESSIKDFSNWIYKLNKMLPRDIVVHEILKVSENWHARFDATTRTYKYFIHRKKSIHKQNNSWWVHLPLNVNDMNEAAKFLLGKKDFSSFAKTHTDVKTHICNLTHATWESDEAENLVFTITADRFLRNMVRSVVGTLVEVGLGKIKVEDFSRIIDSMNRGEASASAPAKGLFLWEVKYPWD